MRQNWLLPTASVTREANLLTMHRHSMLRLSNSRPVDNHVPESDLRTDPLYQLVANWVQNIPVHMLTHQFAK